MEIAFTLDGRPVTLEADPARQALALLREDLGVRSLAGGCSPQGICGCCAAIVGDKVRLTCTLRAKNLHGKEVRTHASLTDRERQAFAEAFAELAGAQCGYCTPGIVMQAVGLLEQTPAPSAEAIDKALNMHVCRCTGWVKVREAVAAAGRLLQGAPSLPPQPAGLRDHAELRAAILGDRPRVDDMTRPGMLHGALAFARHARCRIEAIDVAPALAVPGVVAAFTAADAPGARDLAGWPVLVGVGEECRCAADVAAVVVADSPAAARAGAAAVSIIGQALPALSEEVLAIDIDVGEAPAAALAVEETFEIPFVDPAFLEPDAALAVPMAEGRYAVYGASQDPFAHRRLLAGLLGASEEAIDLESVPCGAAFGGRGAVGVQAHALLAAALLGKPVKIALTMEEAVRLHPKHPAARIQLRLAADPAGRLLSLEADLAVDGGGHPLGAAPVLQRMVALASGPYRIPRRLVRGRLLRTRNPPGGPARGMGAGPLAFALEGCLDRLAAQLGLDPVEIRRVNLADPALVGPALGAAEARYRRALAAGRAAGLALGWDALGLGDSERASAALEVRPGGEVRIHSPFAEQGQNHDGRCIAAAARITSLPAGSFTFSCSTARPLDSGPTLAWREHALGQPAVEAAARALAAALVGGDLAPLEGQFFTGEASLSPEDGYAAYGAGAAVVTLDERGAIEELFVAVAGGGGLDPAGELGQAEGGAHMGLGLALSEEVTLDEAGMIDPQFRKLGVLKSRQTPSIVAEVLAGGGVRPTDTPALAAVAPAVAAALAARGEERATTLPMKGSVAARGMGIR